MGQAARRYALFNLGGGLFGGGRALHGAQRRRQTVRLEKSGQLAVIEMARARAPAHKPELIRRIPERDASAVQRKRLAGQGRYGGVLHIAVRFKTFLRNLLHGDHRCIHIGKQRIQRKALARGKVVGEGGIGLPFAPVWHFALGVHHGGEHLVRSQRYLIIHLEAPGAVAQRGQRDQMVGHAGGEHDVVIDPLLHGLVRHAAKLGICHMVFPDLRAHLLHLHLGIGRQHADEDGQQRKEKEQSAHVGHFLPAILLHCIVYNEINFIASLLQYFSIGYRNCRLSRAAL